MHSFPHVLLVEDDRNISSTLKHALQSIYNVDVADNGRLALYKADNQRYDVIVLDLNLPDMAGMAICQQLRERDIQAPILILSGDSNVLTKIKLLDSGANDYLTKPFSLGELKARLRALIRITPVSRPPAFRLSIAGLLLDRQTNQASRDGIDLALRRKEFAMLECLMEHAGSVVSRDTLSRYAWRDSDNLWTNTIDVHIKYLRDKLDRPFAKSLIKTVHGLGYKLESR